MKLKSEFNQAQVEIVYEGEHHMGAMSINFMLDKKFRGVNKIRSTNGEAIFDKAGPYLIIYDAVMILIFDYKKKEVYHVFHGPGSYIRKVCIHQSKLSYQQDGPGGVKEKHVIHLKEDKLHIGFGNAGRGKMPSAYP